MSRLQANLLLLLAAALWGCGNVAQKTVLEDIGPFTTIGFRGGIGLSVVTPWAVRELLRGDVSRHLLLFLRPSLTFCAALAMQQIAYGGTTVTNASFLVNTTVLFTPAIAWLMIRERANRAGIFGALLAIAGVGLMAGTLDGIAWGDAACLVSALLYSIWIVQVTQAMRRADKPFLLAACQFAGAALLGLLFSLGWEETTMAALQGAIPELTILGVFSTGAAFALQAKAQRWTPPTDAAVLMAAESLFGALAAASLLDERLTPTRLLGAAMIVGAIVLVQWHGSARAQALFAIAYDFAALLGRVLAGMAEAIGRAYATAYVAPFIPLERKAQSPNPKEAERSKPEEP